MKHGTDNVTQRQPSTKFSTFSYSSCCQGYCRNLMSWPCVTGILPARSEDDECPQGAGRGALCRSIQQALLQGPGELHCQVPLLLLLVCQECCTLFTSLTAALKTGNVECLSTSTDVRPCLCSRHQTQGRIGTCDSNWSKDQFIDCPTLCSGPVVATVWEGKGVVVTGRKLVGATNPLASGAALVLPQLALPQCTGGGHGVDLAHA